MSEWFEEFKIIGEKTSDELEKGDLIMVPHPNDETRASIDGIVEALSDPVPDDEIKGYFAIDVVVLWAAKNATFPAGTPLPDSYEPGGRYRIVTRI